MNNLEEEIKVAKREYYKKYREKNKEKIKENNRRYWERKILKESLETSK